MKTPSAVHRLVGAAALVVMTVAGARAVAQTPKPIVQGATVSITAAIEAIDSKARLVTLKHEDGTLETIQCGPECQRFDALKVGDKVTFRYHESIVYAIAKPGSAPPAASAAITRADGTKPGGTMSQQQTAVVTLLEINPSVPSVTVRRADGNKMSFKVEDKKNLEGVKVGDQVQITYTQALAVSVTQ